MTRPATRIDLRQEAYEVIAAATAKKLPQETGGILLGYGQDTDIVVTRALEVDGEGASTHRYVRDDVTANALLAAFLAERASDDPTGYVGEWHSHPAPVGPSPTDITAMKAIARDHDGPLALVVYTPKGAHPLFGLITRRQRWGRVMSKAVTVLPPPPRFEALGPLPADAVRADGPVFISYRQSDGTPQAESIENLLRAAGLVVWRDHRDLRPGTTTDRLEQALTQGLSAAVLVVTPEIAHSDIVRERELPRLLQLDEHPAFSLCIANTTARAGSPTQCDYDAPDRLLRLAPSRTLADKKQNNMLQPTGESEIVRDLLMHRTEQRKPAIHSEARPFTIRVQTRPVPFAMDAGEDDLHIRIQAASEGRLPSRTGLQLLQTTLPLTSDAVYATRARTVRICGGAHLSVALALGAALPETKIGNIEVVDAQNALWASAEAGDDPLTGELHTQPVDFGQSESHDGQDRVAVLVSLTPDPDLTAFERLLDQSGDGFTEAAILTVVGEDRLDPREAARLSTTAAQQIKRLAARHGRAEVHLAFHGPYTMALLVGRHLNTLRTVVYEWDNATLGKPLYTPALALEPGVAGGPITEVLLNP
ncbi:SAVED domain-containing protein [Streptomyces sp. NPDC054975]